MALQISRGPRASGSSGRAEGRRKGAGSLRKGIRNRRRHSVSSVSLRQEAVPRPRHTLHCENHGQLSSRNAHTYQKKRQDRQEEENSPCRVRQRLSQTKGAHTRRGQGLVRRGGPQLRSHGHASRNHTQDDMLLRKSLCKNTLPGLPRKRTGRLRRVWSKVPQAHVKKIRGQENMRQLQKEKNILLRSLRAERHFRPPLPPAREPTQFGKSQLGVSALYSPAGKQSRHLPGLQGGHELHHLHEAPVQEAQRSHGLLQVHQGLQGPLLQVLRLHQRRHHHRQESRTFSLHGEDSQVSVL